MKPHEETWKRKGNDVVATDREKRRVLMSVRLFPEDHASLDLAAAAPDMARAILRLGYVRRGGDESWHSDICNELNDGSMDCEESCKAAKAALKKAGVLP